MIIKRLIKTLFGQIQYTSTRKPDKRTTQLISVYRKANHTTTLNTNTLLSITQKIQSQRRKYRWKPNECYKLYPLLTILPTSSTGVIDLQYCAKAMRANFDEFRLLFFRIFDDMSAKFRAIFRIAQCDISKIPRRNYANSFEISK